jgi:H+/gluconate symporter-like permease
MNNSEIIILTFVITALWDVVLRFMALNFNKLPSIIKNLMPFIGDLEPYFKIHTLLAAALIAGFVGATTQPIILYIMKLPQKIPNNTNDIVNIVKFMLVSFVVSALYGFIMKWSGLFPHLQKYYYDKLGVVRSMYHDGISGLIVQITLLSLVYVKNLVLK